MVLSKKHLLERIHDGRLQFSPALDGFQLQPHAVDLRLGYEFHIPKTWSMTERGREAVIIDPLAESSHNNFEKISLKPGQYFELLPEEYVIGVTFERIHINSDDLMAVLYPRSSINRRGLAVDLSGIIDVGYKGYLMIPIMNNTKQQIIRVYPGERICQVVFETLSSELTPEESAIHGLQKAKYTRSNKINGKNDSEREVDLIKNGKLIKLKEKYKLPNV